MKRVLFAIAAVALNSCNIETGAEPRTATTIDGSIQLAVIEAQEVTRPQVQFPGTRHNPRLLSGKFTIRSPAPGERLFSTNGSGGACLIARVPQDPKACTLDTECDLVVRRRGLVGRTTWHGYCLKGGGGPSGTCWVKPSDDYCLKGPHVQTGQHTLPVVDTTEVYQYLTGSPAASPVRPVDWMVYACLNGVFSSGKPPCARQQWESDYNEALKLTARGPVRPIR